MNKEELKDLISNGAYIVDVREKIEYSVKHYEGAMNAPLSTLKNEYKKIKKDKPVIVYCALGGRANSALKFLEKQGYQVYNGFNQKNLSKTMK